MDALLAWIRQNEELLVWVGAASFAVFVASVVVIPVVIALLPSDYFLRTIRRPLPDDPLRAVLHAVLHVLKNALGALLVLCGFIMLFIPGQGILTILVGLSLLDFPGKHRLQVRLLNNRRVARFLNWCRAKAKRGPLHLPPRE